MKFRFPYQNLLRHRKSVEDVARRHWSEAQAKVDEAKAELKAMYASVDSARERGGALQASGPTAGAPLVQINEFISGQALRIERHKETLRSLMMVAEERHQELVEAAKEYKTLEKLRERMLAQHKVEAAKRELKTVDEIVTTRFRRSGDS